MIVFSVVGARPEFIQAAPVTSALRGRCTEVLVHTGQHYDELMSDVFFRDLDLPRPDHNLNVGSGPQGEQTARIVERMERALLDVRPDLVLLRSDTNSTLGAAVAAAKLGLPIVKIEAGMRSFDRSMPEEVNRIVADHVSDVHLCSTPTAAENLRREGIVRDVQVVGDVLLDSIRLNLERAERGSAVLSTLGLRDCDYVLATVHRAGNADEPARLRAIVAGLAKSPLPVILPLHPRTARAAADAVIAIGGVIRVIEPVSYLDMLVLIRHAAIVATDSGGVQREAYMLGRPCLTLRPNTEWVETVETGWNILVDADATAIANGLRSFRPAVVRPDIFGDGQSAARVADVVARVGKDIGSRPGPRA
jgi:UDP-N-acetylglucosamine 2-epimerase